MRLAVRSTQHEGIPTASMADIAFLLIIFFMVTITFEVDKTQVLLPKTVVRSEVPKHSAYISITDAGQIRVSSGEEISVPVAGPEDVLSFATGVVAQDPSKAFVLKADRNVPYRNVDRVIDALKQSKARVIYLLSNQKTVEDLGEGQATSQGEGG
jgi:biopolymer transport protein ExbD